jgi:hypothetical protein
MPVDMSIFSLLLSYEEYISHGLEILSYKKGILPGIYG